MVYTDLDQTIPHGTNWTKVDHMVLTWAKLDKVVVQTRTLGLMVSSWTKLDQFGPSCTPNAHSWSNSDQVVHKEGAGLCFMLPPDSSVKNIAQGLARSVHQLLVQFIDQVVLLDGARPVLICCPQTHRSRALHRA